MAWEHKARIMKFCSSLPGGRTYSQIQKTFGRLKTKPMLRLPTQAEMAKWIQESGWKIAGNRFFEVGTGHVPVASLGFRMRYRPRAYSYFRSMLEQPTRANSTPFGLGAT